MSWVPKEVKEGGQVNNPTLERGQKLQYEHISVGKEYVYYNPLWNEVRVVTFTTGILWEGVDKAYPCHMAVFDHVMDENWEVIGEL